MMLLTGTHLRKWVVSHSCTHLQVRYTREKIVSANFISSRDGPENVQKKGRDIRMQEDYSTSARNTQQM